MIFAPHPNQHESPPLSSSFSHLRCGEMSQLLHPVTHHHCDRLTFASSVVALICSFLSLNTAGCPCSVIQSALSGHRQDEHAWRQETCSSSSFTQEDGTEKRNDQEAETDGRQCRWITTQSCLDYSNEALLVKIRSSVYFPMAAFTVGVISAAVKVLNRDIYMYIRGLMGHFFSTQ